MTQSVQGFFSGGGKTVKFPQIGASITGKVLLVHPPEPQTDIKTKQPILDQNQQPRMQVRITLETSERDPQDPQDDGQRTLYVKGWMKGAIGDACRKAGVQAPEPGGVLTVTFTHEEPSEFAGFDPTKKYTASYQPPHAAATNGFFGGQAPAPQPVPQPSMVPGGGYVQQPAAAPQPQAAAVATAEPQKPPNIAQGAWDAMDPGTKAAIAATMSQMNAAPADKPPF